MDLDAARILQEKCPPKGQRTEFLARQRELLSAVHNSHQDHNGQIDKWLHKKNYQEDEERQAALSKPRERKFVPAAERFRPAGLEQSAAFATLVVEPHEQGGLAGLMGSAAGMGFVIGPLIGGFLYRLEHTLPYWFASGVMLFVMVGVWELARRLRQVVSD